MRVPSSSRARLSSLLALAVLASSSVAWPSHCIADAIIRSGANEKAFVTCITSKAPAWFTVSAIQTCLSESGCSEQDAQAHAHWAVDVCGSQYNEFGSDGLGDINFTADELRKRIPADDETTTAKKSSKTTTADAEAETTSSDEATTTEEAKTTEEKTTTEKTTTKETTSETSTETTETTTTTDETSTSTTASTASSTSSTSATAETVSTSSTSYNTSCYTTITYTTEGWDIITSQTNGRVSRTWDSSKLAAKTRCADGLYCDSKGQCFEASNELQGTSGLAVTIFFGAATATAFSVLILLCCRDRRKDKKLQAQAEAAKIAKEQAAAAAVARPAVVGKRVGSSGARRSPSPRTDRQPLMGQGQQDPFGSGPFGDRARV